MELHGHRGARGHYPENTLAGFAAALGIGVTALEMDLGVTRDGQLVVHHDYTLNPDIARVDGRWLSAPGAAIRARTLQELSAIDVGRLRPGTRYAAQFPEQRAVDGQRIPTLAEVIALTRRAGNHTVGFDVEAKSTAQVPDLTAAPAEFAALVVTALREADVAGRSTIQSFDWRVLQAVQELAPEVRTGYLQAEQPWYDTVQRRRRGGSAWLAGFDVNDHGGSLPRLVHAAGGDVWMPYHGELTAAGLAEAHALGLTVIVWTVNEPRAMHELIEMGVDGLISDYPQRLREAAAGHGLALPAPTPVPEP